ncbi:uncharacterized protein LOC131627368 [Vicia villosa]|uniref:uncharacterized protein LOC131627368 n=1 Tax=Vicia villosa TaxID=3911 RepID=UPI00273B28F3|nr:uncharacterized protein LOC131627368 [Vicia villosa]
MRLIWKLWAPSKVRIFGWRLLKDRLPTRKLLVDKNIVQGDENSMYVFCGLQVEEANHLFIHCVMIRKVWEMIQNWLGIDSNEELLCSTHFLKLLENMQESCSFKKAGAVWLVTYWCIWNQRNDIIFNNAILDLDEIVHKIKMHSWWWLGIGTKRKSMCNWYEWFH